MTRKAIGTLAAFLALAATLSAAARGADDLLERLPEKTFGFVRLNRIAETDAKLAAFAANAQWPMPGLVALFKSQAGVTEGLDEKGTAALVIVGEDRYDQPPMVLFVPVTDYDKFLAPLKRGESKQGISRVQVWNSTFLARRLGSYAVFAEPRHEELLQSGLNPGNVRQELAPLIPYLEAADLSAAITHHGIFFLARLVDLQVNRIKDLFARAGQTSSPGLRVIDFYGQACRAIEDQAKALVAGLQLEKQGALRLGVRASLVPSSPAAAAVAKIAPCKENLLSGLPAGPFVLAAGVAMWPAAVDAFRTPYAELLGSITRAAGISPSQTDQLLNGSLEMFKSIRAHAFVLQAGRAEPIYGDAIAVTRVESAKKFLADYERHMKACPAAARKPGDKLATGLPLAVAVRRTEIQGMPGLEIELQAASGPTAGVNGLERLIGHGGKLTALVAAADETTVLTGYVAKDRLAAAAEALKRPEKAIAADPLLAKTKALLPGDALALAYWSPSGTVTFANRILSLLGPLPGVPKSLPEFPRTPPVGFAARTAPAEIHTEAVVPAEVIQSLMAYGMQLVAAFQTVE